MSDIFLDVSLVLVFAAIFGGIAVLLRQPSIVGYVAAGILAGLFGLIKPGELAPFETFAQIGVALLLFLVGLEMNVKDLRAVGRSVVWIALGQMLLTFAGVFFLVRFLGFDPTFSAYTAGALTFSSTIIGVKLLSEKKDLQSLYGRVAIGVLLLQDLVAILALIFLSGIGGYRAFDLATVGLPILKGAFLLGTTFLLGRYVFPPLVKRLAHQPETLFVASIAWALGFAALVGSPWIGFSVEIGGFLAGVSLASTAEHFQIGGRVRPLRDFFVTLFFVVLGLRLFPGSIQSVWPLALFLSLFVILIKPLIVIILMGLFGFRHRTSFLTGLTLSQISEFSLIVAAVGFRLGHVSEEFLAVATLVGVATMVTSTYAGNHAEWLATRLTPLLRLFQRRNPSEPRDGAGEKFSGHTVLVGAHRMGESILRALRRQRVPVLVVDFDPEISERLRYDRIPTVFGDISDPEVQEQANLKDARLVISTAGDVHDSLRLLGGLRLLKRKPVSVLTAQDGNEAKRLYEAGADYVILPHFVSGEHLAETLRRLRGPADFRTLGRRHRATLSHP